MPTCSRLADDTVIVDLTMTSRDHIILDIDNVYDRHKREGILIDIPRTNKSRTGIDSECAKEKTGGLVNCDNICQNSFKQVFNCQTSKHVL